MKVVYPETSREAYKSLDPNKLNQTYRDILFALSKLGEGTYEDVSCFLKCNPSKVWKRLSELHKAELIYRPGNKRLLRSGRNGFTWMLSSSITPKTQTSERALKGKTISDYSKSISYIQKNLF